MGAAVYYNRIVGMRPGILNPDATYSIRSPTRMVALIDAVVDICGSASHTKHPDARPKKKHTSVCLVIVQVLLGKHGAS